MLSRSVPSDLATQMSPSCLKAIRFPLSEIVGVSSKPVISIGFSPVPSSLLVCGLHTAISQLM